MLCKVTGPYSSKSSSSRNTKQVQGNGPDEQRPKRLDKNVCYFKNLPKKRLVGSGGEGEREAWQLNAGT